MSSQLLNYQSIDFKSVYYFKRKYRRDYEYGPHKHSRIEINYVERGRCTMHLDNDIVDFNEGSCMVIFPGIQHYFRSGDKSGVSLIQLEFEISNLNKFFKIYHEHQSFSFLINLKTNSNKYIKFNSIVGVKSCIERIIDEENNKAENYKTIIDLYYRELILLLSREINKQLNFENVINNEYLIKALEFINGSFCNENIKIEDIARNCNISSRYLRLLFKEHLKLGPIEYINKLKVNGAKKCLTSDLNSSVKEIAYKTGFSSPQYFSMVFKKYSGFSPLEFKERYFRNA